jgi:pteridine reductase
LLIELDSGIPCTMPVALVTGGAVRLGRAIALELADHGHDIIVCAHGSADQAHEVARAVELRGRRASVEIADLSRADDVDALVGRVREQHNNLDVLVHNAAIFEQVEFAAITRAQYARMQAINAEAPFFLTQGLLPLLLNAPRPVVVQIVDNTWERPIKRYAHYMMSKAASAMLVKALAIELGPRVRVCGVAPGFVAFPHWWSEKQREEVLKRVPLERAGSPEDVARAVRFIVESDYLTGVILPIDGGRQAVF